jgi:hypothetical protein
MGKWIASVVGIFGTLVNGQLLVAADAFPPAEQGPLSAGGGISLGGHFKMAPPASLGAGLRTYLRGIHLGHSAQMVPMLLLGFWGYPDFAGISATDPVSVFFFQDDGALLSSAQWLACAKIEKNSPIWPALALQGLHSKNLDGWVFLAKNRELLEALAGQGRLEELKELAMAPSPNAVRMEFSPPFIRRLVALLDSSALKNLGQTGNLAGNMQALSFLHWGLHSISQLENFAICGDVRENLFEGQLVLRAREGTDLAKFFNAPIRTIDCVRLASLVPADGTLQSVFRYDPTLASRLIQDLCDGFFCPGQAGMEGITERETYNHIENFFRASDGAWVVQCSPDGNGGSRWLWGMAVDPEQLAEWVDFAYTRMVPVLATSLAILPPHCQFTVATEVDRRAFVYRELPIIHARLRMQYRFDGEDPPVREETRGHYFCALADGVAAASNRSTLEALVDASLGGKLESNSLAEALPLDEDVAHRLRLDPGPILRRLVSHPASREWPKLSPTEWDMRLGNDQAQCRFTIGSDAVGAFLENL